LTGGLEILSHTGHVNFSIIFSVSFKSLSACFILFVQGGIMVSSVRIHFFVWNRVFTLTQVLVFGFWFSVLVFCFFCFLVFGFWFFGFLVFGFWFLAFGIWVLGMRFGYASFEGLGGEYPNQPA